MTPLSLMRSARKLVGYALDHPVGRQQALRTIGRIISWQLLGRLRPGPHLRPWIGGATLVVERGMSGATGNLYFGLHEFADMAFALHFLRAGDTMLDIGANAGTYTVLAAKVANADVLAFEPDAEAGQQLDRNIAANGIANRVRIVRAALGAESGTIGFTKGLGAMNHVALSTDEEAQRVAMTTLDEALQDVRPVFAKIDVEGHEQQVLEGATRALKDPALTAILIETVNDRTRDLLVEAGFSRWHYDPVARQVTQSPGAISTANHLYLRSPEEVQSRVRTAAPLNLYGWKV